MEYEPGGFDRLEIERKLRRETLLELSTAFNAELLGEETGNFFDYVRQRVADLYDIHASNPDVTSLRTSEGLFDDDYFLVVGLHGIKYSVRQFPRAEFSVPYMEFIALEERFSQQDE